MSKKEAWLVSVMVGYGKTAQYLMSDTMTFNEACDLAESLVSDCENGEWILVGHTFANPNRVTTIRVVKERETERFNKVSE
jgi:hypothetical protein